MNDQLPINRVEQELAEWKSKESRFDKLFSSALTKERLILTAKMNRYENILAKYRGSKDSDEQLFLKMINSERKRLLIELYPSALKQFFYKLRNLVLIENGRVRGYRTDRQQNIQFLHRQLLKTGFKDLFNKVEQLVNNSELKFSIPVSYYVNEKERLNHELIFTKSHTGNYQFDGYKTVLYNELRPDEIKEHFFKSDSINFYNTNESYNLLQGRAVEKNGIWTQFDLNDKDHAGNYRIKEFHSDYGYDLEKILVSLSLKGLNNKPEFNRLLQSLKYGSRESIVFSKDKDECKFFIEADPHFKTINIYDENSKKITLSNALTKKSAKDKIQHEDIKALKNTKSNKRTAKRIN